MWLLYSFINVHYMHRVRYDILLFSFIVLIATLLWIFLNIYFCTTWWSRGCLCLHSLWGCTQVYSVNSTNCTLRAVRSKLPRVRRTSFSIPGFVETDVYTIYFSLSNNRRIRVANLKLHHVASLLFVSNSVLLISL